MSIPMTYEPRSYQSATWRASAADLIRRAGRLVALAGVALPLLFIGGLKFTQFEVEALKPMIGSAPWLSWMYALFGEARTSYLLGVVEITTALLLIGAPWFPRAGVVGGAIATLTFLTTTSLLFALPIWEPAAGGFPALNGVGGFLIKDVALLGISLVVLGESMVRSISGSEIEAGRRRPVAAASGSRE
jgi:reactive chlorine resistance protein C